MKRSLWQIIRGVWCFHTWHKSDETRDRYRCCESGVESLWVCCRCLKAKWTDEDPRSWGRYSYQTRAGIPLPEPKLWPPRSGLPPIPIPPPPANLNEVPL